MNLVICKMGYNANNWMFTFDYYSLFEKKKKKRNNMTVKNDMVEHNSYTSSVVYLWDLETFPTAGLIKVYKRFRSK